MAIDLWLLRHGEAEPHGLKPDAERELTDLGREQSLAAGSALAALRVRFDVVYASPKIRAWDTAALACEALGIEPTLHEPLAYGVEAREARALVAGGRVLLVGHDPYLSQIVYDATGARVRMAKGGVAGIRSAPPGVLALLLRPAELLRISG